MKGTPSGKGYPSSAKRRNLSVVRSVVKQKIAAGKYHGDFHFGGPEEDRTPEPFGCERANGYSLYLDLAVFGSFR